ncbi:MAG: 1-(5-phosphoribosyl)-5-[(5-phosphoribosylamino)methylideneamino]imidazole-4-carboxamide isomerase [Acidimicrobiales bacterium]
MTELYPAIDLRDGCAVRLIQGDFDRQQTYGEPLALARHFVAAGAGWLHVVDLDAARTGRPSNRSTVLALVGEVDVPVQSGGGVRSEADVDELLDGGVARVVLGTAALEDAAFVRRMAERHPGRIAVGLDYRRLGGGRRELAGRGWEVPSGRSVESMIASLEDAGVAAVVATAIDRDGTLAGPDLEGLAATLASTAIPLIGSGGVGGVADLISLAGLSVPGVGSGSERRLAGVITGKALLDGRMSVEEGVAACRRSG